MQAVTSKSWLAEERELSQKELVFEFFLNQLRLKQGVFIDDFSARTGLPWQVVESRVQQAIYKGLLEIDRGYARTTELGWKFVNDIQQMFLP
jgi:coproporphyrinogen III oxidase-like Fe-S oxidoreductase